MLVIPTIVYIFWVMLVPGRGPEQRESAKTVLYLYLNIFVCRNLRLDLCDFSAQCERSLRIEESRHKES